MENKQIHNIPASYAERDELRNRIQAFVGDLAIQPPLSLDDLSNFADQLIREHTLDTAVKGWVMVEIHNQVWKETIASIPYERRVLLLPKCLSNSVKCQAEIDELGLLCHRCAHCPIPDLQDKAESLGIMSIVAEGFTSVVGLIQNRVVDSVIGVSCLDSLEKAFPLLIGNAVPGLAIPLNRAGCKDTQVDYGYVIRMMSMRSDRKVELLDYDGLRADLGKWFSKENLASCFSPAKDQTSSVALDWMGGEGKRWRPYLLAATYLALTGETEAPADVQRAAIAVECFHKASLVHDDIQDNDKERYGKPTINALYGVSIAINVGDILLGEGYRLLSQCDARTLTAVAADAHIALCRGQGMELEWSVSPRSLTLDWVLEIFCNKTVPAFEVSLMLGLICAGDDEGLRQVFHTYSRALGIAYQLLDDIEDFKDDCPVALRPSAILAVLCEQNPEPAFIRSLLECEDLKAFLDQLENKPLLQTALERVGQMADSYHQAALAALREITNVELKRLLFRVTEQILK
ncbi:polyprenyl synthetase family protein [Parabacteroides sp. ZJ-118]|uniref:polyprenyl synthetase family protein n=1 Tax=Parabacteroides sp. ZJ-118 TaxID=2709398 RepID=UPI0013EC4404|nr:polyprenyl synthetase family protein [Parabacteroides sp. ZJ-118]